MTVIGDQINISSIRANMDSPGFAASKGAVVPQYEMLERAINIKLPANVTAKLMMNPSENIWDDTGKAVPAQASVIRICSASENPVQVMQMMIDNQSKASKNNIFCIYWLLFQGPDSSWFTRSAWVKCLNFRQERSIYRTQNSECGRSVRTDISLLTLNVLMIRKMRIQLLHLVRQCTSFASCTFQQEITPQVSNLQLPSSNQHGSLV